MRGSALAAIAVAFAIAAVQAPVGAQSGADFSVYVALGDGLTAGYQDGALHAESQLRAYPNLIAAAADTTLVVPLVEEPGIPTPNPITGLGLVSQRPGTCDYGQFEHATGRSTGRLDPSARATLVAVPFQRIGDARDVAWRIDPSNPNDPDSFEDFVLGYPYATTGEMGPSSQLQTAVALGPTFVTVWLGPADAYRAAVAGDVDSATLTPQGRFDESANAIFEALEATGARGVILNIPDVTATALLLSQKDLKRRTHLSTKQLKKRLGVFKSSYVPITALPTVDAIANGEASGPLGPTQILDKAELARIQEAIDGYNRTLAGRARALGWPLVDLNALFATYDRRGVDIPSVGHFTTNYLGGIFDLDGLHLSDTGQALVAAAVIGAINDKYGTSLPFPDIAAVAAADPHTCGVK